MRTYTLILLTILCLVEGLLAVDIGFSDNYFGKCANPSIHEPLPTFFTLREYYCINERLFPDSTGLRKFESKIGKEVFPDDSLYRKATYHIYYAYSIARLDNIIFLSAYDPVMQHYGFSLSLIYSSKDDKIYSLENLSDTAINNLLDGYLPEKPLDNEVLDYCRLFTILHLGGGSIRFISSIKEILMEAIYWDPIMFTLSNDSTKTDDFVREYVNRWNTVTLELPTIKKNENEIEVSFYLVQANKISKITMTIDNSIVINFQKEFITNTLDWYGKRPRN
jgi:hypothetical protein